MDSKAGPFSGLNYRWRRRIFRFGIWNLLYRFWFRLYVEGWENIPAQGPVILMGNHISALDPVVMISFYPDRDIVPLAKVEAWDQFFLRYFVRHWGAIPTVRGKADLSALKEALAVIQSGDIAMLYAEGTRGRAGLQRGEEGSAYLAAKCGASVVPVGIWGTRDFPHYWFGEFQRMPVYIRFGRPFRFKQSGKRIPLDQLGQMTNEAMYRIAALLPPEWRGIYSELDLATTEYLDMEMGWDPPSCPLPKRVTMRASDIPST